MLVNSPQEPTGAEVPLCLVVQLPGFGQSALTSRSAKSSTLAKNTRAYIAENSCAMLCTESSHGSQENDSKVLDRHRR